MLQGVPAKQPNVIISALGNSTSIGFGTKSECGSIVLKLQEGL